MGKQLDGQGIPKELESNFMPQIDGQPVGLQGIKGQHGQPRIIVPKQQIRNLIVQTHNDTLHQGHNRIYSVLMTLYYWSNMPRNIARICGACALCKEQSVRRSHLAASFQARKLEELPMPRQSYGIDFYGVPKGEILVIVDHCTRETILVFMSSRNQDKVARALLSHIIFTRGVPTTIRSDSAPELVSGWVADINAHSGINQVRTGGYNCAATRFASAQTKLSEPCSASAQMNSTKTSKTTFLPYHLP